MMALVGPERRCQFLDADRAVAVLIEFSEHAIGLPNVGAARAKRLFEFRLADLAVTVAVDLPEQVLQRGVAGLGRPRSSRGLALRVKQRAHGFRRYRRK